ncbi:MAG: hypothetical protein AABX01_07155 [Candidatus Micrarchaeota archaeon]
MERPLTKAQVEELLSDYAHLPHFRDGRINFTDSRRAPIIACFVEYRGRILLMRRSSKVGTHRDRLNNISGYIDKAIGHLGILSEMSSGRRLESGRAT